MNNEYGECESCGEHAKLHLGGLVVGGRDYGECLICDDCALPDDAHLERYIVNRNVGTHGRSLKTNTANVFVFGVGAWHNINIIGKRKHILTGGVK